LRQAGEQFGRSLVLLEERQQVFGRLGRGEQRRDPPDPRPAVFPVLLGGRPAFFWVLLGGQAYGQGRELGARGQRQGPLDVLQDGVALPAGLAAAQGQGELVQLPGPALGGGPFDQVAVATDVLGAGQAGRQLVQRHGRPRG